jgi:diguanylate cyclase (GGDEF)-like protein
MALTDNDLHELAELFLEKRLSEFSSALERCHEKVKEDFVDRGLSSGALERGLLVSAWAETFNVHCQQVLKDLVGLMRTFDSLSSAEGVRKQLDAHLDAAADYLARGLAESRFGGVSTLSPEQKRVANMVTGVKRQVREAWDREHERVAREAALAESLESAAEDLDDRLPLSRRGAFDRDLVEMVEVAARACEPLSLVMVDIDHFKTVNDDHGHPVGDDVLLEVANLVFDRVRRKGKGYRYGGEEFAILLPTYSAEEAVGLAERIRKDIAASPLSHKRLEITASFGVACLPDHTSEAPRLVELADAALYRAKNEGRNQVQSAAE